MIDKAPNESFFKKKQLRKTLRKKREELSTQRRVEAAQKAFQTLSEVLKKYKRVLSFASFDGELNLWLLNQHLATTHRLLLPRVYGLELKIFAVEDLDKQLHPSPLGIKEPIPLLSVELPLSEIEVICVPGLGFDKNNHRIGYGKGYYDRLLAKLPGCHTIGIGFHEQLVSETIPTTPHDIPLKEILLF